MLIDTNALSAWADGDAGLNPIFQKANLIALPVVVLGEYRFGIRQSRRRDHYEVWLETFLTQCEVLNVDVLTTIHYAAVRSELKQIGRPIPANDMWIAALARQHRLPVLTRDRHFDSLSDLLRINWHPYARPGNAPSEFPATSNAYAPKIRACAGIDLSCRSEVNRSSAKL